MREIIPVNELISQGWVFGPTCERPTGSLLVLPSGVLCEVIEVQETCLLAVQYRRGPASDEANRVYKILLQNVSVVTLDAMQFLVDGVLNRGESTVEDWLKDGKVSEAESSDQGSLFVSKEDGVLWEVKEIDDKGIMHAIVYRYGPLQGGMMSKRMKPDLIIFPFQNTL